MMNCLDLLMKEKNKETNNKGSERIVFELHLGSLLLCKSSGFADLEPFTLHLLIGSLP